jgi:hypothetical protein
MIEFEVDMSEVADELDTVILHDECGERESVEYVRKTEYDKLRELLVWAVEVADDYYYCSGVKDDLDAVKTEMKELGIEVE